MAVIRTFNASTHATLKRMARQYESRPQNRYNPIGVAYEVTEGAGVGLPARKYANLRGYVVVPKTTIPASKRINIPGSGGGASVRLGKGTAHLWRRDQNSASGRDLILQRDENGDPVEVDVYNLCPTDIVPVGSATEIDFQDPVLFVVQDMWGDLYVVEKCLNEGSSASTSEGSQSFSVGSESQASEGSQSVGSQSVGSQSQVSTSLSQASISTSAGSQSQASQPAGSQSAGSQGSQSVGSLSTSLSFSGSASLVSTSQSVSVSASGSEEGCCTIDVVTDVTFDPVACSIDVTKTSISYQNCNGGACPDLGSGPQSASV